MPVDKTQTKTPVEQAVASVNSRNKMLDTRSKTPEMPELMLRTIPKKCMLDQRLHNHHNARTSNNKRLLEKH
jgi:hypothetical protein